MRKMKSNALIYFCVTVCICIRILMYRCEKDSEVLGILNFLQSKVWNLKQFAYQNVFIWSLFCEKKLGKKKKKKSKAKTQRKRNPRNSYYVEIRLPYVNAVRSRSEESASRPSVCAPAFQPATATTAMTPSSVSKSAPESPSGTGRKFLLEEDNYPLIILRSVAFSRYAPELRGKPSMKL